MANSKEYAWSNVEVLMLGRPVTGVRGIDYKSTQEKEVIYGRGNKPRGIQSGNKAFEGSLSLFQSELEALLAASGTGSNILDLAPFDVVVAYVPLAGGTVVTDIIKNVEFTEAPKTLKQGDKFMEVELPFIALDIQYNV